MNVPETSKQDSDVDNIQAILEVLKTQINQYTAMKKTIASNEELTRSQKIEKLAMEEKRLSMQFQEIRKETKYYQRKYERALKKKVKMMKLQIKGDRMKLNILKQKYHELDERMNATARKQKNQKSKGPKKIVGIKRMKPIFKQKTVSGNKKIKIKIKKNEKLGKREMMFINDSNSFANLVKTVVPKRVDTKECKIMLQKLSEDQVRKYVREKCVKPQQKGKERSCSDTSGSTDSNQVGRQTPTWQIKIPKLVFEESQKLDQSFSLGFPFSPSKDA